LLAAALRLTHGVEELSLTTVLKAMTVNPANLLGLPAGRLAKAAPADLILIDLGEPWVVNKEHLSSRSKNSPFDGAKFQGRVKRTVVAGQTVFPFEKVP
jgi:dihydroorotase